MSEGQTQRIRRLREDMFLVTDDSALDIIEAVLAGDYLKAKNLCTDLTPTSPDDYDKPCPTCGGSKWMSSEWDSEVPVPCPDCGGEGYINKLTGKITEVGELAEGIKCSSCGGSGERLSADGWEYLGPCNDCGDDHFIPGKGRGM